MGTRLLSELRTDLVLTLDSRTDLSDSQLNNWINITYNHLSQPEVRWHHELETVFDITLATGISNYAVDSTTVGFEILDLVDVTFYDATTIAETTTRHDVQPRNINWLNKQTLSSTGGGPRHYTWQRDRVFFATIPVAADNGKKVRLEVYRAPAVLSTDGAMTVLDKYWDRAIVLGAKWIAELDLGYAEQAEASRQEYVGWLNERKNATELGGRDTRQRAQIRHESHMPLS